MLSLSTRLFIRIISKGREVYALKIITLAIAFAVSTLILLFSLNEFGYDKFHDNYESVFRVLERNNSGSYSGNRLSNKIRANIFSTLKSVGSDSIRAARVKLMDKINVLAGDRMHNIILMLMKEFTIQVVLAILFFGPVTYIVLKEILRTFVYATGFGWLDPVIPIAYCIAIITLLCSFQTLTLRREDLSSALKR